MTGFFTHCCKRASFLLLVLPCLLLTAPAAAEGIESRTAALVAADEGYALEADFHLVLNPTLEDVLNKGVPLYFVVEFELIQPRWYWFERKVVEIQQQYRLSYDALTRQYRLGAGGFFQSFSSLSEALNSLGRVRRRQVIELAALRRGDTYTAALRMRLDVSQLPKPFQLNALGSRDWDIASDWRRWELTP
jgi:hypothetical protein